MNDLNKKYTDGYKRMIQSQKQMKQKRGKYYERWKAGVALWRAHLKATNKFNKTPPKPKKN